MDRFHTWSIVVIAVALASAGCNNKGVLPSGNELAENNGAVCEPKPASELEDCKVFGQEGADLYYKEDFRDVCESKCRYLSHLSIGWVKGVTNLEALENRKVVEGIIIEKMPDLKTTRGLDLENNIGVILRENPRLQNLSGFEDVTVVDDFRIKANNLKNLDAFEQLEWIDSLSSAAGNFDLARSSVSDASALDGVDVSGVTVRFYGNDRLGRVPALEGTPKSLNLHSNAGLSDVSPLTALDGVRDNISIVNHPKLKNCELEQIAEELRMGSQTEVSIRENNDQPCN
jgi:hypothetical protein